MKFRKNSGSKKREKSLEISRFPAVWLAKRLFPSFGSKLTCHHGWDSRTRTCKARVKVSCVAVTPYPIGIVRTPGKGAFVCSFGIITQRGFLVNIPDSHSGGRRSGQGYRTRGQYPRRENGCGGRVRFVGYLRCPAWADVCDFGTVRTAWRLMLRRQVTCGGGIRIVRDAHGGLAHADCTRVWGVRWKMRGVREHGVRRICASVRSDALRDFPCIRMRSRFSGAVFG